MYNLEKILELTDINKQYFWNMLNITQTPTYNSMQDFYKKLINDQKIKMLKEERIKKISQINDRFY